MKHAFSVCILYILLKFSTHFHQLRAQIQVWVDLSVTHQVVLLSRFSRVRLCATPETAAHQASLSLGFSRQEKWSGLPFPSPMHESGMSVSSLSRRHGGREENVLQSIKTAISRKTTRETSRSQNRDFSSCLTPSCRWHVAATGGDWTEPGLLRC